MSVESDLDPLARTLGNTGDPLADDFRNFLYVCWEHLGLPEPTEIQYDIAHYLQTGPRRKVIQAFRGVGKSWITACFALWLLYNDPNERILVISASSDRARAFTIFTRRLIEEMEILQHLIPTKDQRDSAIAFDVAPSKAHQAPSVRSVGITGQMTGGRATHIILDDVEVPRNSLTQAMRDNLGNSVKECDAVLSPNGCIHYLGTPQTEMSLYNTLPERGYEVRIWTSRYPGKDLTDSELYLQRLAPFIRDKLTDAEILGCEGRGNPTEPTRFSDLDLLEREASYGRSGFQMQFMLSTNLSDQDRYPLKMSDLMVMALEGMNIAPVQVAWSSDSTIIINDIDCVGLEGDRLHRPIFVSKDWKEYQGTVLAVDPAGRGQDELSYAIVSMLNGFLYLRGCVGLKGGYTEENLKLIAEAAKHYKSTEVYVEATWGDGMFTRLLTPVLNKIYPCHIEEMKSNKQKELRIIDTLEPVMQQHKLIVSEELIKADQKNYNGYAQDYQHNYQLFHQLTRITRERKSLAKDDRLDSVAMAVARWSEQMDQDTSSMEAKHLEKLRDQANREFIRACTGKDVGRPKWNGSWT